MPKYEYSDEEVRHMAQWGGTDERDVRDTLHTSERGDIFKFLTGEEVAELVEEMYETLGPEVGCRLVEPNVILTLAGLKGMCDIPWAELSSAEREHINGFNAIMRAHGYRINMGRMEEGTYIRQLSLINLQGISFKTQNTNIPGVLPYDNTTGFSGFQEWNIKLDETLERAINKGDIPPDASLNEIQIGILLGYPDQAILDIAEVVGKGLSYQDLTREKIILSADILSAHNYAAKYKGAAPEFDYLAIHAQDPRIRGYITSCRQVLQEFYESEQHQQLRTRADFIAARERYSTLSQREIKKVMERARSGDN